MLKTKLSVSDKTTDFWKILRNVENPNFPNFRFLTKLRISGKSTEMFQTQSLLSDVLART